MSYKKLQQFLMVTSLVLLGISCQQNTVESTEAIADQEKLPENVFVVTSPTGDKLYYEDIDGMKIMEGDIVLTDEQIKNFKEGNITRHKGVGTRLSYRKWTNKYMRYSFFSGVPQWKKNITYEALAAWHSAVVMGYGYATSGDRVAVASTATVNNSPVGRRGGRQTLNLSNSATKGTAIHEFGHALGLMHEQTRNDRDSYIIIKFNNIKQEHKFNFYKAGSDFIQTGGFDFNSIMLYGSYSSFAINTSRPVMTRRNGSTWSANRSYISNGDKQIFNTIY
jgi:hypothetical protein